MNGRLANARGLALCAGAGGVELGLSLGIPGYHGVGYVEREAYAAAVLMARMADKALAPAPVWCGDLAEFDAKPWRGAVDIVTAGLPCQPYSVAGAGKGHADDRALWPEFIRSVRECEPAGVFLENVPPFLKHFGPVYERLREMGFIVAPPMLATASESGAPHIRRRLFIAAAHPDRARLEGRGVSGRQRADELPSGSSGSAPTDADGGGRGGEWCGWVFDRERQTLRHDADGRGCGCRINGTVWSSESPVLRVDDGPPARVDELRAIGNGASPIVVARCFLELWSWLVSAIDQRDAA